MTPRNPQPSPTLDADSLITLNANLELSRAAVCALADTTEPWWLPSRRLWRDLAAQIGVRRGDFARARATLRAAGRTAAAERALAAQAGAAVVTRVDAGYPEKLLELALPPPVLYLRGRLPRRPGLSVVGSRRASAYGMDVAGGFAADLASRGLVIVSGFARGVDTAAHRAAVAQPDGVTVAVLGCGIDVDYPRGREALRREISRRGAIVSEFPCGAPPVPFNFPIRNRLIAALGFGTMVVEATVRSGSLITARLALELGRNIYAVPGRIFDPRAQGPNALIRDGAFLVQHPKDLLLTLTQEQLAALEIEDEAPPDPPPPKLPKPQQAVIAALVEGRRLSIDELAAAVDLPPSDVQAALLELELAGWVRRHPGPAYARSEIW